MLDIVACLVAVGLLLGSGAGASHGEALFEDNIVVPLDPNHTHRGITGTILELKDGSLLYVHSAVGSQYTGIVGQKSTDGGRSWSEAFSVQPKAGLSETAHPSLLRLDNGKILLAYDVQNLGVEDPDPSKGGDQHMYVRLSSDEGQTWAEQICATFMPGICHAMPDKVLQLSTGRIIMPVESPWPVKGKNYTSLIFYSDNGGYTWWPSNNVVDLGSTTEEPSVVELADGRLVMFCRNRRGYMARSYSEDQGLTWSEPELVEDLPHPSAGFHVVRIPTTGDLLCVWCNNEYAPAWASGENTETVQVAQLANYPRGAVRSPLTAAISRDGGQTWEHHRNIAEDPEGVYGDYGYPGISFIEDGQICLVNYHATDGLHIARIGVDWFYEK